MNDRVSTYPGRVTLIPVPGQANKYDMTMADEPTQEGTPPTKANLLSDATAAKFGGAATPNAAFDLLSRFNARLGNEYVWKRSDGVFVNSPVSNAYPPAVSDGYTYTALGQIGDKARIATGSYVGTGTTSVEFVSPFFIPRIILVSAKVGALMGDTTAAIPFIFVGPPTLDWDTQGLNFQSWYAGAWYSLAVGLSSNGNITIVVYNNGSSVSSSTINQDGKTYNYTFLK